MQTPKRKKGSVNGGGGPFVDDLESDPLNGFTRPDNSSQASSSTKRGSLSKRDSSSSGGADGGSDGGTSGTSGTYAALASQSPHPFVDIPITFGGSEVTSASPTGNKFVEEGGGSNGSSDVGGVSDDSGGSGDSAKN